MKFRDKVILIETLHEEAVDIAKEAFSIEKKGNNKKAIELFCKALTRE